jgi:hypothetical protein
MGKRHQLGDVAQAVAGIVTGTKAGAADVHRIRAMKNRFTGNAGITGRAQEFKMMVLQAHRYYPLGQNGGYCSQK